MKIDCVILYKDRKWSIYPRGIFYTHSSSLIAFGLYLFTIKVCRWYARKTSYCLGRENQRYITATYLRSKSTLNNINLCIIKFKGRKQKIKATATFTAEWTLQNKSLVVYYTSITKSTLIDGLHYLYTIKEAAWNIHGVCMFVWNETGMNIDDIIDNNLMEIFTI